MHVAVRVVLAARAAGRPTRSDEPVSSTVSLPGSSPDSASSPAERGPGKKGRRGDTEQKADESDKPERSDKDEPAPGGNGRWGSGGKRRADPDFDFASDATRQEELAGRSFSWP